MQPHESDRSWRYVIDIDYPMIERAAKENFRFVKTENDLDLEWEDLNADAQARHRCQVLCVLGAALEEW
jgi:hypothetical protein